MEWPSSIRLPDVLDIFGQRPDDFGRRHWLAPLVDKKLAVLRSFTGMTPPASRRTGTSPCRALVLAGK